MDTTTYDLMLDMFKTSTFMDGCLFGMILVIGIFLGIKVHGLQKTVKRLSEKGFSLLELVTITAIIATLAIIAIPQFSNYRSRAFNDSALSDLRNAATAQEAYFSDNQVYTNSATILVDSYNLSKNPDTQLSISAAANSYTMTAYQPSGNRTYTMVGPGGTIASN